MCKYCNLLRSDRPFKIHRTNSNTGKILIGKLAENYLSDFENRIYNMAMINSIMTCVIGHPGVGKTQMLHYIDYVSKKKNNRLSMILDLKDKTISDDDLTNYILKNESVNSFFKKYNYDLVDYNNSERNLKQMQELMTKIRVDNRNNKIGFCLLIDSVDEYVRKMESSGKGNKREIIRNLLGTIMSLFNDLSNTCVVFAITRDLYTDLKESLKDTSQGRRFSFVTDKNGEPIILDRFDFEDSKKMVHKFMELWSERNGNIQLPCIDSCNANGVNTFPFTEEAIELFWEFGSVPGDIAMACSLALNEKIFSCKSNDIHNLIVNKHDAAEVVRRFSTYFVNYGKNQELQNKLDNLLDAKVKTAEIEGIRYNAKKYTNISSELLIDSFSNYLKLLNSNFGINESDKHVFIKNRNHYDLKFENIDLLVHYKAHTIGFQFLLDNKSNHDKIRAIFAALTNNQINEAIFIVLSNNLIEGIEKRINNNVKKLIHSKSKDYSYVVELKQLDMEECWEIIGLHDLENRDKKEKLTTFIDNKKLKFDKTIFGLINKKPLEMKINKNVIDLTPGSLDTGN